jgi:hypothetical protein
MTNEQWETWESLTEAVEAHHQGTLDRPVTTDPSDDPSDEEREELGASADRPRRSTIQFGYHPASVKTSGL